MDRHETQDDERIRHIIKRTWPYKKYTVQILKGRPIRCRFLVSNHDGVWSLPQRKYIKRTRSRHHRVLTEKARALREGYIYLMDELAMATWPEFTDRDREEVRALIAEIADMHWTTMPRSQKEYITQYHREQRIIRRAPVQALRDVLSSFVVVGELVCVALLIFVIMRLFFF